jgi:hypothetical protein
MGYSNWPEPKLGPIIVSVNAGPPAVAKLGLKLMMVGGRGLIVNVAPADS